MSIDINNANFKIFTDFAATAKQSARAQLDSKIELNGEMRTVKPAGGLDFIGNVGPNYGKLIIFILSQHVVDGEIEASVRTRSRFAKETRT